RYYRQPGWQWSSLIYQMLMHCSRWLLKCLYLPAMTFMISSGVMLNDIYDLVRRADGKAVYSFQSGGRSLVDTSNGIPTIIPVLEDEFVATVQAFIEAARRAGYQAIPPAA